MSVCIVELTSPAKKSGGDKYEGEFINGTKFNVYVPQFISRVSGQPAERLKITIDFVE
jgi:hypothetical protein